MEILLTLDNLQHLPVEIAKPVVAQFLVIHQIPLTTGILIAPSIALAREVNPFGMTELITHEVQVATVDSTCRHQSDHLMQGNAATYHIVLVTLLEVPIHIGINQTEDNRLVAHQCLVVTLAVRDGLLVGTAVLNLPEDRAYIDVLIAHLLDSLNPIVGDVHGHTIVETIAAILELSCESRHSRYFLGNGNSLWIDLMNQAVGQCEVADGIIILMSVEVVAITTEGLTQTVRIVKHRGDTVETETVEVELLQPILTVREQEVEHVVLTIVKAERIPCRMLMTITGIEELVGIACKISESLDFILHSM